MSSPKRQVFLSRSILNFAIGKRALWRKPRKKGSGRRKVIVVCFRAFKGVESKQLSHGPDIYLLNCFLFGIVNLALSDRPRRDQQWLIVLERRLSYREFSNSKEQKSTLRVRLREESLKGAMPPGYCRFRSVRLIMKSLLSASTHTQNALVQLRR